MFGEEDQDTFCGFDASRPNHSSSPKPETLVPSTSHASSSYTVDLDLSEGKPMDRPSPLKTFTNRWKKRRDDLSRHHQQNDDLSTESTSRRSERVKRDINRFDPSVSSVEVQAKTGSVATQTVVRDDLSQWLRR